MIGDETRPRKSRPEGARDCPWPACRGYVKGAFWGCPSHWANLPEGMRRSWMMTDGDPTARAAIAQQIDGFVRRIHESMGKPLEPERQEFARFLTTGELVISITKRASITLSVGEVAQLRELLGGQS